MIPKKTLTEITMPPREHSESLTLEIIALSTCIVPSNEVFYCEQSETSLLKTKDVTQ